MAHFAKLNSDNQVIQVVVVNNSYITDGTGKEKEEIGIAFLRGLFRDEPGITWKQTSYNGNTRKNYAGIGYTYDSERDAFIPPKPYASWVLNDSTAKWEAPVPMPTDGKFYKWDELTTSWVEVVID